MRGWRLRCCVRLNAAGAEEDLPAMSDGHVTSPGATVAEREAARGKCLVHNQAVARLLEQRGFVMTGQAHVSAPINRYLQTDRRAESRR